MTNFPENINAETNKTLGFTAYNFPTNPRHHHLGAFGITTKQRKQRRKHFSTHNNIILIQIQLTFTIEGVLVK